jgi:N-acyl-D-aspartate/D-glutamate deacylase
MAELAAHIGRPVTFAMTQNNGAPDAWRALLDASKKATEAGAALTAQVAGRPSGLLFGLGTTYHPLDDRPSFQAIRSLPSGEATHQLRDPEVRARILAEAQDYESDYRAFLRTRYDRMFPMPDPVDYEPSYEQSIAGIAAARGVTPVEALLDLTADNPAAIFQALILNYANGDAEPLREMLQHPAAAVGLSDGGAHVAILCDASIPTTMLTHWARDRRRGERLPLELVVKRQTHDTAHLYGLGDRGVVAPGMLADLNVIDFEHLNVQPPELRYDLPGGARRLVQRARGYVATIKSGVVTVDHDELTGARPGALVRGAR